MSMKLHILLEKLPLIGFMPTQQLTAIFLTVASILTVNSLYGHVSLIQKSLRVIEVWCSLSYEQKKTFRVK